MATLMNKSKNEIVAKDLKIARSYLARGKGLLGRKTLPATEALWINPCRSIHTMFMNFTIDAAFVDRNLTVRAVYHGLTPWRLVMPFSWKVHSVFELAQGVLRQTRTEVGDQLYVVAEDS
jgi:uncharacterized protein